MGGHGDPTLKEGLAIHQYAFDADMIRQAFVNHDGDLLLIPQHRTLDIQTEMGHLRVGPGAIAVLPAGIRFAVRIVPVAAVSPSSETETSADVRPDDPDASAAGYALEIFGAHFTLPELGPIGANGLAHPRDFEYPVASFDAGPCSPEQPWKITVKLAGKLSAYQQAHTPFDVVAWHGVYAPFRYHLSHFVHLIANSDQLDPTAHCVLTAPSKWPGVSLVDFCVFGDKWAVASGTLRVPYHHRTMATEVGGVIKGKYLGSVRPLEAGGMSFEQAYCPHGESYECWKREREREAGAGKVCVGYLGEPLIVAGARLSVSISSLLKWS
jgi:homogentisate 1,2-dioxygenase